MQHYFVQILSGEQNLNSISKPQELEFVYDLKIENEIKKSTQVFEKFVSYLNFLHILYRYNLKLSFN